MTDHSGLRGEVVAVMYEIGGRYRQGDDRREFDVYEGDLAEKVGGPVPEDAARLAYRARRDGRNDRRGGGVMNDARREIEAGLYEPEPTSEDLGEWAAFYDRKAKAAELLRDEAHLSGDLAGADVAEELVQKAQWAARELRRAGGGS